MHKAAETINIIDRYPKSEFVSDQFLQTISQTLIGFGHGIDRAIDKEIINMINSKNPFDRKVIARLEEHVEWNNENMEEKETLNSMIQRGAGTNINAWLDLIRICPDAFAIAHNNRRPTIEEWQKVLLSNATQRTINKLAGIKLKQFIRLSEALRGDGLESMESSFFGAYTAGMSKQNLIQYRDTIRRDPYAPDMLPQFFTLSDEGLTIPDNVLNQIRVKDGTIAMQVSYKPGTLRTCPALTPNTAYEQIPSLDDARNIILAAKNEMFRRIDLHIK